MDTLGYLENGTLSEKISDNLDDTHNLYDLFELFMERLNLVSNETFPNKEEFDLKNISKIIEEVHDLLWGVDGWLDHYIQMSNDIIHDYEEAMRFEMVQEMRSYYY